MVPVIWLEEMEAAGPAAVGGKGYGLGRLAKAGFSVPHAFTIPVETTAHLTEPPERWPEDVKDRLREALEQLAPGGEPVAVRSSATAEDSPAASFAGQHLTALDVRGAAGLLDAIAACLASLHSATAEAYRSHTDQLSEDAKMAVVVQRMIRPDVAGVAFSMDPVSGDASRVVVEGVAGLGEALVSGSAEAHRLVFGRVSLGLVEEHCPDAQVLSVELAREIARAALRAEEAFGTPQDIEFAVEGGQIWMLQSRAVTKPERDPSWPPGVWRSEFDTETSTDEQWTSANIQEVLPAILTPLTMSTFKEYLHKAYTEGYQDLRVLDRDEWPNFVGLFYNRAFLNVGATRLIAERVIGADPDGVEHRFLGGEASGACWSAGSGAGGEPLGVWARAHPRPLFRWERGVSVLRGERKRNTAADGTTATRGAWKYKLRTILPMLRMSLGIHRAGERIDRETRAMERRVRAERPSALTGHELSARRRELSEFVARAFRVHLQASGCAGFGFEQVAKLVRPVLGAETEGTIPALFGGMRGVESAQIGLDLWQLSRAAMREGLADAIRQPAFDPRERSLPREFSKAFEDFLERHGHRGVNEMEPAAPNWRQDPGPAIAVLRSYLDLPEEQSPEASLRRQEQERLRLTDDLAGRMNFVKSRLFRFQLKQAQGWIARREHTKSVIVRGSRLVDYYLPEAGRRLAEARAIARADDIFFLAAPECDSALTSTPAPDLKPAVTRRRREMERNRHVVLPERFRGTPRLLNPTFRTTRAMC